ncbi:hypothetical protein [Polaribacter sp.]|uniref:hypothetical protein n=1 Tax=Polaribacter sp. TaxID=1920175 RepID=UPI0040470B53
MKKQHITILFFLLVCIANAQNSKNDTIIKDGKFLIGKFINGKKEGAWKIYIGNSKKNLILREEGTYKNDKKDGKWTIYEFEKVRKVENYKDDNLHGEEITYFKNGKISSRGNYVNDEADGQHITYYENGFISAIENYKIGVEHGKFISYFENGKLEASTNFVNGIEDGEFIEYDEDGKIINKGMYKNGEKIGPWIETKFQKATLGSEAKIIEAISDYSKNTQSVKIYDTDKKLIETGFYQNEKKVGEWLEYRNGNIIARSNYQNGLLNGKWEKYDWNNLKIKETGYYSNDQKSGLWKVYDDFFNLKETGSYLNGKKNGEWTNYYTNIYSKKHFLSTKENYLEGKLHGKKYHYKDNQTYKYEEFNNDNLVLTYFNGIEPMYEKGEMVGEHHWKNNVLEKTLKYVIKDNTIVDYEIWKDGKYLGLQSNQHYKVHFRNKCSDTVSILVRYRDDSNNWVTEAWYKLKPNEEGYLFDTKNTIYYYFAESKTGIWKGTDNSTTHEGKLYNLKKKEIKDPLGKTYVNLTCNN